MRKLPMKTQDNDKEIKVIKIPLKDFIESLMEVHSMGASLIDLVITKNTEQDIIGIVIRHDYSKKDKLTEEDLNKLLE